MEWGGVRFTDDRGDVRAAEGWAGLIFDAPSRSFFFTSFHLSFDFHNSTWFFVNLKPSIW